MNDKVKEPIGDLQASQPSLECAQSGGLSRPEYDFGERGMEGQPASANAAETLGGQVMAHGSGSYVGLMKNPGYASLLIAQALSVFNDNAFRYVLLLIVISVAGTLSSQSRLVSCCNAIFVLPYILFSSYAGQVADRFSKRRVIVVLKLIEVALMVAATLAVYSGNIAVMLLVLFMAGIHSSFLAPAKEGILPQMLPDADLSRANGLMQLTVYTMIIVGPVVTGILRPSFPGRGWAPVAFLIPLALGSFAVSLGIARAGYF